MGEKSDEIIDHIESQRDQLGRNLEELETRVKRTTDWKAHFEENPALMLGIALGGGLLLGALVGGKSERSSGYGLHTNRYSAVDSSGASLVTSPATSQAKQHAVEALDKVKAALIGFGMMKAKDFLSTALPGIEEHLSDLGVGIPTSTSGHPSGG
jgi:hypothetical protein